MFAVGRRALCSWLIASLSLAPSLRALADEPKAVAQPVGVDMNRLYTELELFAAEEHRTRLATAVTGFGIGSALIPAGIVLLGRTDGVSQALVIGMIVGGGAQLLSVLMAFLPTRVDEIRKQLRQRILLHADTHDTVRAIETGWSAAAAAGHSRRTRVGVTMLGVGVISLASGLTLLIASEGIFGMSRKNQYTWGGVLMGTGIPVTTLGARFLLEWSPEESAWEAYRTMKADGAAIPERPTTPSVSVVPTPGGALALATLSF